MRLARVLPGVAIGFVAVVILGPGNARPVLGARVYAATVQDEPTRSARIGVVWSDGGTMEPYAQNVDITVVAPKNEIRTNTGARGVAEIVFDPPLPEGAEVVVRAADAELALGHVDRAEDLVWDDARPLALPVAHERSAIYVEIAPLRGQLIPSFSEAVVVRVVRPVEDGRALPLSRTHVVVDLVGGSPARTDLDFEGERNEAVMDVQADAMRVDFEVRATNPEGHEGTTSGSFPMAPGAIWLAPRATDAGFELVSSAPRSFSSVSFWTREGRIGGAQVPMKEGADAFHRGAFALPAGAPADATTIVVSGDAAESGSSTVAWPVTPPRTTAVAAPAWRAAGSDRHPRLRVIGDGVRVALAREASRVKRVRGIAIGVALLVGLIEIILLVREGRRAQRDLDAHFATQADAADDASAGAAIRDMAKNAAKSGSVMVTILGAMIALAFGIIAAFVVAR